MKETTTFEPGVLLKSSGLVEQGEPSSGANTWLRSWTGPITNERLLDASKHLPGKVPLRVKPDSTVPSICGYCSTGCSLEIHLQKGRPVNLTPDPQSIVNFGMACPKGWEALSPLQAPDRATTPLLRDRATGAVAGVDWNTAMQTFTKRFRSLMERFGPESVAFLSTGQICTEEMALLGALWRFGIGAVHCDSNTRQCMATAATAYKESFGFDAPPFTYTDFEESDVLVFIGANPCVAHPILWQRVLRNRRSPQIIVLDPRKTETAMAATLHLPLAPKSDLTLLYGVAHLLIQNGWIDEAFVREHTSGFDEFAKFVRRCTPDAVAEKSGLTVGQIYHLAESVKSGRRVSFWWTMGVNQSHEATRTAQAIINLALLGGHIGKPGTGANSITGQCNAMGSRLFANVTSLLGGHSFGNPEHRRKIAMTLDIPESLIPAKTSLAYDQIIEGIAGGTIKGLWVIATNPAHSWIGRGGAGSDFGALLDRLDFLVVQDMYHSTDTARHADLLLPAAGWGEKEGTFINSERRIGLVKKAALAPGQALADFHIFRLVAHYWGCGELFSAWRSPEAVFQILKRCSAGQPCDITGIQDYRMIEACDGVQWPWPESSAAPETPMESGTTPESCATRHPESNRRLFEDGRFYTPDGRARFIFDPPREPPEIPDAEFPFILLTGRGTSAQWHTNTRTGKSALLRSLHPAKPCLEIHPSDAGRLCIQTGDSVALFSRRGRVECSAFVTPTVQPGSVFLQMHHEITNRLTLAAFDPVSRQPAYKHCAVSVEPVRVRI